MAAPEAMPVRFTVCTPAPSLTRRLLIGSRVGGSFTAVTVKTKLLLLTPPSGSAKLRVMVALPV